MLLCRVGREGLSVHVRFAVGDENGGNGLFANDTFIHYFAESELEKKKVHQSDGNHEQSTNTQAFDGLSCTAFKLDKLKMGEQAKRIAVFEDSRRDT